jgi:hypothetical protein
MVPPPAATNLERAGDHEVEAEQDVGARGVVRRDLRSRFRRSRP